ncbi:transposase [Cohnella boryungensis]|uniref:Transposase n=1 Tax=Cohnella boryungensis TaxID=768479 RepID=A0ABV8S571_9BACL
MGDIRQHFDEEFKRQTVKHMLETGKTPSEVSKELDVPVSSLRRRTVNSKRSLRS